MVLSGLKIHLSLMKIPIVKYNKVSDEEYFCEFNVKYPENLYRLHVDLQYLP